MGGGRRVCSADERKGHQDVGISNRKRRIHILESPINKKEEQALWSSQLGSAE